MPTPARTSLDEIVRAGRDIVEGHGLAGLTMQRVADAVGVRAPSLYKRLESREHLVRLVVEDVARDLSAQLDAVSVNGDPRRELRAQADAFRAFARAHPESYALVFARLPEAARPDPEHLRQASEAVVRVARALAGPEHALAAARTFVAWANGFVSMELAGAFRLGGDVDEAYRFGVDRLADALATR